MKTTFRILPPVQKLKELFRYNPETGEFTRLRTSGYSRAGEIAGSLRPDGYLEMSVDGKSYMGHRIAWAMFYGEVPTSGIDHINMSRGDNRITNLRLADKAQNGCNRGANKNNKSGIKGVCWDTRVARWLASITVRGKQFHLGHFKDKEEAGRVYAEAAKRMHQEYSRVDALSVACQHASS